MKKEVTRKILVALAKAICACGAAQKREPQQQVVEPLPAEDCQELLRAINILQQTFNEGGCTIV